MRKIKRGWGGTHTEAQKSVHAGCAALQKLNFPCHGALFESIQLSLRTCGKHWNRFPKSLKALSVFSVAEEIKNPQRQPACVPWERRVRLETSTALPASSSRSPCRRAVCAGKRRHTSTWARRGGRGCLPQILKKGMNKMRQMNPVVPARARSGTESAGRYTCPHPARPAGAELASV